MILSFGDLRKPAAQFSRILTLEARNRFANLMNRVYNIISKMT